MFPTAGVQPERDPTMKPTADQDDILTGEEATQYMTDRWNDPGAGMTQIEVQGVWLVVRRSGGTYTTFISMVDDTAVTITDPSATSRHIPKDLRPDGELSTPQKSALSAAFDGGGGGSYPLPDEGVFSLGFTRDGDHIGLRIGLNDDTFTARER